MTPGKSNTESQARLTAVLCLLCSGVRLVFTLSGYKDYM